jgi:hypothetical protein
MAVPGVTDAELDAVEARNDPADIPHLVAALRQARAALSHPFRLERAQRTFVSYLRYVDRYHSVDGLNAKWNPEFSQERLVKDCTVLALETGYIRQTSSGELELTKRGNKFLPDISADDL